MDPGEVIVEDGAGGAVGPEREEVEGGLEGGFWVFVEVDEFH